MKEKTAKEYILKNEWYRSDYFINPETGDVYDELRPNVFRCMKGLQRFIDAQDKNNTYQTALKEIKEGKVKTRWSWFIFPQMADLGFSEKFKDYVIINRDEASDYVKNKLLMSRLIEITEAVYNNDKTVYEIFGDDAIQVCSCMKLFASVSDHTIFKKMIDKYCWK